MFSTAASRRALLRSIFFALVALILVVVLGRRFGIVPPVGPLLSPGQGVWARNQPLYEKSKSRHSLAVSGLREPVEIVVDRDQIKHLFAKNDHDLYFTQGYVLASERLWEMDFLSRTAAGRLSEIMGERTLEIDKYFRRMGLSRAAEGSAEEFEKDPTTRAALEAYVAGVNAYVATLDPHEYPLEYRLLGHAPEPWTALRAAQLLKFMAWNLSGHSHDLRLSRSAAQLSGTEFDELFPLGLETPEPIIPRGTKWSFKATAPSAPLTRFQADLTRFKPLPTPDPSNGSNNWAVTGKKSTTGLPILSNDIHLNLYLPSLWYEMQLVSPTQNVYGIALPGAPGVILGFNSKLAWGVTNAGVDVLDWYQLRFRDEKKSEYLFNGQWRPVIAREEIIKVRGRDDVTLVQRQTHFGPIVYGEDEDPLGTMPVPVGAAMRWVALEPSNELKTFLMLNRASTVDQCREAIEHFVTPAQNFLCVDNRGQTGIFQMGRFPLRWKGQGRMILDGSNPTDEWAGWIPRNENPMIRNPERGYLSSANQAPTDAAYPHYLGWPFDEPYRGMRINEMLKSKAKLSPEDLIAMQGDLLLIPARDVKTVLVGSLDRSKLDERQAAAVAAVEKWDSRFTEDSSAAPLFDAWLKRTIEKTWLPRFPDVVNYMRPPLSVSLELIAKNPTSKWFDDPKTTEVETLREVAHAGLEMAIEDVSKKTGTTEPSKWTWARYRPTHAQHIGRLPGFGNVFPAPGHEFSVFANKGIHGPVWKLVVAVGSKPKAWAIYPGGQSGDPLSPHYDDFLESWRTNSLKEVRFLESASAQNDRAKMTIELTPGVAR